MRFRLSIACILLMFIALVAVAAAGRNTQSSSEVQSARTYGGRTGRLYSLRSLHTGRSSISDLRNPKSQTPSSAKNLEVLFESDTLNIIANGALSRQVRSGRWTRGSHDFTSNNMPFGSKQLLDWYMWLKDILGNFDLEDIIEQARSFGGIATMAVFTEFNLRNILKMFRKISAAQQKIVMVAIIVIGIILVVNPETIWISVLNGLGFSQKGPVAGSFAASIQGPLTSATSWFAFAQSASMGGYCASIVNNIARPIGSVLTAFGIFKLADLWNLFSKVAPYMSPADFVQFYPELVDYWPTEF